jgi:O-antigen biosynthesis protein WbqP
VKRTFDIAASLPGLVVLTPVLLIIGLAVKLESPGPALHWSKRVGRRNQLFSMPKFRTMRVGAPDVATHLLNDPKQWITPLGRFLRKTSLDEFPQLWSVLVGDMSLVGPRPALFNQDDLIGLRTQEGVDMLRPGMTGWAQINGRDEISIPEKVRLDREYLERRSLLFDIQIILKTLAQAVGARGVSH